MQTCVTLLLFFVNLIDIIVNPPLAAPANEIPPTYPAFFKFTRCGEIVKVMFTAKNRPGMIVITMADGGKWNDLDYLGAIHRAKVHNTAVEIMWPCK